MKIEDAKIPNYKIAIKKLEKHPDEVFTQQEADEKFGDGIGEGLKYAYRHSEKVDRFLVGPKQAFYGVPEAIQKLRERFEVDEDI